jgi:hypothetical protein
MRAVLLFFVSLGGALVAAACVAKTTAPDGGAIEEPDGGVPDARAPECNESCQLSRCCGTIEGLRVDLDRKCRARDWVELGCTRMADGGQSRCMILDDEAVCVYRATDAGLEVYGHQFGVLPRGFEFCTVAMKERYFEAMQGEPCP